MSGVFPSLSTDGYVEDRGLIAKKIMETFISSFENQSNLFPVNSYKYIVSNFEHGIDVANQIELQLGSMYEKFFDTTNVKVEYNLDTEKSVFYYTINVLCYYNGQKYEVDKTTVENIIIN